MRSPSSLRASGPRSRRLPSPALVLAFLAFTGGVVGPAWATGLLTGDDIKNGSLTGKDIKDGSVGPSDLSRMGRAALEGETGPAGSSGPAGPAGPTGLAGPHGPPGLQGTAGSQGASGQKGADGADAIGLWAEVTDREGDGIGATASGGALNSEDPVTVMGAGLATIYIVGFTRDVSTCAAVVTRRSDLGAAPTGGPGDEPVLLSDIDAEAGGSVYTFHDPVSPKRIRVRLLDQHGQGTEGSFSLVVRCP